MKQEFTRNEQVVLLRHIGGIYRKGIARVVPTRKGMIGEGEVTYHENSFSHDIDLVLTNMNEKYARIIKHDFLIIKESGWWKEYYARSTYYRYKNIALMLFFRYL